MRMELCLLLIARMRTVGAWPVGKSCELSVVVLCPSCDVLACVRCVCACVVCYTDTGSR